MTPGGAARAGCASRSAPGPAPGSAGRRGTRDRREPLALRTVADDRQPDVVARLPGTDDTARRDVEAVEVRERAVVDELYGARQRSGGRRALAKIARVG